MTHPSQDGDASRQRAGLGLVFTWIFFLLVGLPSLLWIALDRHPFGGDQSQDAAEAVNLYMVTRPAKYFVTVDPRVYPVPSRVYNRGLDAENFPVLLRNVRESGRFEAEPPLREEPGIWIFRRRPERRGSNDLG